MKLTDHCYAVLGLGYSPPWVVNAGFIIGAEKTLIIDSGPNYLSAQTIYGYSKNLNPHNEILVINTEKHFDHIGGNSFFSEKEIKIYAHKNNIRTNNEFGEEKDYFNKIIDNARRREAHEEDMFFQNTYVVKPDKDLTGNDIFLLGRDEEAKIIFTPGHTASNISVYFQSEKVLYCGDLIVNGYIPNLEAGNIEDWKLWIKSLEFVASLEIDFIVPGHGNIILRNEVNKNINRIISFLKEAISENKPPTVK